MRVPILVASASTLALGARPAEGQTRPAPARGTPSEVRRTVSFWLMGMPPAIWATG